jgi:hypothetical protein
MVARHPITGRTLAPATGSGWLRLSHAQARARWTMVGQEALAREERLKEDGHAEAGEGLRRAEV